MHLHVLIGRTGVGKTARSIALAKARRAPVLVLDRVQVFPELTIGSGRPLPYELEGTKRIYLAERRVTDGELTTIEAYRKVLHYLRLLDPKHPVVILEGGSISLCTMLFEQRIFDKYPLTMEHITVQDEKLYRHRQLHRILEMLRPQIGRPSILDELANVWSKPEQRAFVRTVGGYGAIVEWCERAGISPCDLRIHCHNPKLRAHLAGYILPSYLEYSYCQNILFHELAAYYSYDQAIAVHV